MLIRLQRIYNFWLFHAVILSLLDVLQWFYNNFISFFGTNLLTRCPVPVVVFCFFYIVGNQYQKESKRDETPGGFFGLEESQWAKGAPEGLLAVTSTHQGTPGGPGAPRWVLPTSGSPWTSSSLYKYHNIPKTLGESIKYWSSRRRVQNHQIQPRHRHGGVHHFHWCLSYDAWLVLCRPSGP